MIDDYIEKWIIKAVNDLKVAECRLLPNLKNVSV